MRKLKIPLSCIALACALSGGLAHADERRPLIDWFAGKFRPETPAPKKQPPKPPAAEVTYSGDVPPADGRAWVQMATSPDGGAADLVQTVIDSARTSIRVAAYEFTSKRIAEALLRKHRAGVSVMVVVDKSQLESKYTAATFLANQGVPVRVDSVYAIQHSKFIVVDADSVQTGSFNYTESAISRNGENVLVVWHHTALAKQYGDYWLRLWQESAPFPARY